MKEQIKAPEKIQLSHKEIANLSDAEFKTLVIRMLTEFVGNGRKIEEIVKAMKSEMKENIQARYVTSFYIILSSPMEIITPIFQSCYEERKKEVVEYQTQAAATSNISPHQLWT